MEAGAARPPVFGRFSPWRGTPSPDCQVDWLGVETSVRYHRGAVPSPAHEIQTDYPQAGEEIFEWIDLLEAVIGAGGAFTMVELGAGYGRWLADAAAACRQVGIGYRLIGVEAEPAHFGWMREHLERNNVNLAAASLIHAAVAGRDGRVTFRVGRPFDCYGQRIVRSWQERVDWRRNWHGRSRRVRALSLASVLDEAGVSGVVDLIDLDVQSAEADVLEPAAELLDARVRRVHIGTHDPPENEHRLRRLFGSLGWELLYDYGYGGEHDTPFGRIEFQDGVQSWRNPRLIP